MKTRVSAQKIVLKAWFFMAVIDHDENQASSNKFAYSVKLWKAIRVGVKIRLRLKAK